MHVHVLRRRPLLKAKMHIKYLTAGEGSIVIDGEHIQWQPLSDEHFAPLLKHAPKDMVQLREFLLESSKDWTGVDWQIPVYEVGWPGERKLRVEGAKAAIAALRQFYPFKDYGQEDSGPCSPSLKASIPLSNGPTDFTEWAERSQR